MIEYTDRIKVDPWPFKMYLDGKPIDTSLVKQLHNAYEILRIAEFLLENYNFLDDETAWELAEKVLRTMDKLESSEELAINLIIDEYLEEN